MVDRGRSAVSRPAAQVRRRLATSPRFWLALLSFSARRGRASVLRLSSPITMARARPRLLVLITGVVFARLFGFRWFASSIPCLLRCRATMIATLDSASMSTRAMTTAIDENSPCCEAPSVPSPNLSRRFLVVDRFYLGGFLRCRCGFRYYGPSPVFANTLTVDSFFGVVHPQRKRSCEKAGVPK